MKYICSNNLPLWQSMTKPQQTNEHMREVINHSTYTHLLNTIKSILTQTLEKLWKKRVYASRLWQPVFLKHLKKKIIKASLSEIEIVDCVQILRSMCIKRVKRQHI